MHNVKLSDSQVILLMEIYDKFVSHLLTPYSARFLLENSLLLMFVNMQIANVPNFDRNLKELLV